jgi:cytochrome c oxidase subunit 3/cytochrome o ubiquinol oxidase subunit 3
MSATSITFGDANIKWDLPSRGWVGMISLIAAEAAIFSIFVVAYLFYIGKNLTGPTPKDVLSAPIFYTICLLSSSLTIHFAAHALRRGSIRNFAIWWFFTIALGAAFLYGTATEWHRLIYQKGLTISTNLF